jgi:hypothetical protein
MSLEVKLQYVGMVLIVFDLNNVTTALARFEWTNKPFK